MTAEMNQQFEQQSNFPNPDANGQMQHLITLLNNFNVSDTSSPSQWTLSNSPPDNDNWHLMHNCLDRIELIVSLINVPDLGCMLSLPLKRKLSALSRCQLSESRERAKAMRIAIAIGNRITSDLLVKHTEPHQMISGLWSAVRSRGCQFLGPAIQEEILKLVILALEDGQALTRRVLIHFIMSRLLPHFPSQTSKTSIGHVVQILYRASCFEVIRRNGESSLMRLKEEYRNYASLRREHDIQIVSIAIEAGLRISPEQWSSLLYGDNRHKPHMQSIVDKLQSVKPSMCIMTNKLKSILSQSEDPIQIMDAITYFEQLAYFEANMHNLENLCTLQTVSVVIDAVNYIIIKLLTYLRYLQNKQQLQAVH